jgi:hypothetical protein
VITGAIYSFLIIAWISVKDTVGQSITVHVNQCGVFTASVDWVIFPVIAPVQEGIYVYLNTGSGFDSGQQWQNDLGDSWKNNPIQKGGEHSTLIDMNGDGLPDRVFDRNPSSNQDHLSHFAIADLSQNHYLY